MNKLLELAIDKLKESSEEEQNRIAKIILKEVQTESKLSRLWQKIDELGVDENEPSLTEITAIVKGVRHE